MQETSFHLKKNEYPFLKILQDTSQKLFHTTLWVYTISLGVEFYSKGFVTDFISLNIILITCITSGILSIFLPSYKETH